MYRTPPRPSDDSPLARLVGPGAVRLERRLPGPIERVWAHLVDPALRATWLAGGDIDPKVGGRVALAFRHAEITDDLPPSEHSEAHERGQLARGVVTAWQPPRRLAHTWDDGDEASEVTFELSDDGGAVRLAVTHRRLDTRAAVVSVAAGWDAHLGTLAARLADEGRPPYWRAFESSEARHAAAFADEHDAAGRPPGAATLRSPAGGGHRLMFRRRIDATVDTVWRVLAEPDLRDRWYPAELRFEGAVGGWARERFPGAPMPLPDGTLTAWDPPHRLAFTMEADPGSNEPSVRHPQDVVIELEADGAAARLTFDYGFGDRSLAATLGAGWHVCVDAIAALAEGRAAEGDHTEVRRLYEAWFAGVAEPEEPAG
jgi:uncharacterized protein YndB with AHSA1/START domain